MSQKTLLLKSWKWSRNIIPAGRLKRLKEIPSENFTRNPDAINKYVPWSEILPKECYKTKEKK